MADVPVEIGFDGKLKNFAVTGSMAAPVSTMNAKGGVMVAHVIVVPNGATGDVDLTIEDRIAVIDVVVHKRINAGGAGDSVQLTTGNNEAITEPISLNGVAAKKKKLADEIDATYNIVAANGTLRVKRVNGGGGNVACTVIVYGVRW